MSKKADIWEDLVARIEASGQSPYQIGHATGIHPATIYRIRDGEVDPHLSTVQAILDYLEEERPA